MEDSPSTHKMCNFSLIPQIFILPLPPLFPHTHNEEKDPFPWSHYLEVHIMPEHIHKHVSNFYPLPYKLNQKYLFHFYHTSTPHEPHPFLQPLIISLQHIQTQEEPSFLTWWWTQSRVRRTWSTGQRPTMPRGLRVPQVKGGGATPGCQPLILIRWIRRPMIQTCRMRNVFSGTVAS